MDAKSVLKVGGAILIGAVLGFGGYSLGVNNGVNSVDLNKASQAGFESGHSAGYDEGYVQGQDDFVPQTVQVTEVQTIEKEVYVDNENLATVLQYVYDEDGNINYVLDDLKDDELDLIVDRIILVNDVKSLAVAQVQADIADEVDKMEITLADTSVVKLDEDDIERIRIDDDAKDIALDNIDFEDGDFEVTVTGRFQQDDNKFDFEAVLSFKDGKFDEFESVDVSERV